MRLVTWLCLCSFASSFLVSPQNDRRGSLGASLSHDEIERYSRHLVLSDVGKKGQERLKDSAVLVIGAGGLGSPCLMYLAAAGVGHVGIVDADTVDASNLQRQIIHGTSTIDVHKTQSAMDRIADLNPFVNVRQYREEFTSETALRILQGGYDENTPYDVVIDGSDNFPTKYLINDACEITGVPWIYSAILAFEGQLSTFNFQGGPDYRDLLPTPPNPGDVPSCAEGGVLGVLPGTMGCLQATEALKIILGHNDGVLSGRVLAFDALQMRFTEMGLERRKVREEITSLIDYQGFCGGPQAPPAKPPSGGRTVDETEEDATLSTSQNFHNIDPNETLDKLVGGWSPYVLDVRLQTENDIVQLPFTDRVVPHRTVRVTDIPTDGDVLVYCKAGIRGKKACATLISQGVDPERLYNLDGGIMRWRQDVDNSMPKY